ncbi:Rcs stress response system protein RcsF [Pseudidiomarina insulisalsae]|uniref:RcsF protein n=1 Tax=Pseudidiomarina insulisalsae TaxID=575789 RepID=A0A432YCT5_9GAMM|nr:Rcs stress response system protein RcsF [Pseudidiomarina insulisalsae]RUO58741.1 hypothetical protein CWI71_09985 [Pseudidiomarina insulisalsae]
MRFTMIILLCGLLLAGCSTPVERFPASDLTRSSSVEFMRSYELSRTDVEFISMGEVYGESCERLLLDGHASQEEAMIAMKIAAADKQANRIILKSCQQDQKGNCSVRWRCTGEAYQARPLQ